MGDLPAHARVAACPVKRGGPVARAKRTARAEARRRYRAESAARETAIAEGSDPRSDSGSPQRAASTRPAQPSGRPGFLDGFRASLRPANIRADVQAAPGVLRSSRVLWIPFALEIAAGIVALVPGLLNYQIPAVAFSSLVAEPFVAPLLAGLLAPRGAWLFGLLSGLLGAVLYAIFLFSPAFDVVATQQLSVADKGQAILVNGVVGVVYGLLLGAFAGFYRRFLRATTPARSQARNRRPAPRSRR
jgi:hypothetical protein